MKVKPLSCHMPLIPVLLLGLWFEANLSYTVNSKTTRATLKDTVSINKSCLQNKVRESTLGLHMLDKSQPLSYSTCAPSHPFKI